MEFGPGIQAGLHSGLTNWRMIRQVTIRVAIDAFDEYVLFGLKSLGR